MSIKQEWIVASYESGMWLSSLIKLRNPELGGVFISKALKNKDIKKNNVRINADSQVIMGDSIICYWSDKLASRINTNKNISNVDENAVEKMSRYFSLVFKDDNLLILNKTAGVPVHNNHDTKPEENILINLVRAFWRQPDIVLCHRLDRNTSGLIILAQNNNIYNNISLLIRSKQIRKFYRCLVRGIPDIGSTFVTLTAWLEKDNQNRQVYIHANKQKNDKKIITRFRLIKSWPKAGPDGCGISELEVELITGRTHQIRAQLASIGHPLLGDGKYGRNSYNRLLTGKNNTRITRQQLSATTLIFPNKIKDPLANMAGRIFNISAKYDIEIDKIN